VCWKKKKQVSVCCFFLTNQKRLTHKLTIILLAILQLFITDTYTGVSIVGRYLFIARLLVSCQPELSYEILTCPSEFLLNYPRVAFYENNWWIRSPSIGGVVQMALPPGHTHSGNMRIRSEQPKLGPEKVPAIRVSFKRCGCCPAL